LGQVSEMVDTLKHTRNSKAQFTDARIY